MALFPPLGSLTINGKPLDKTSRAGANFMPTLSPHAALMDTLEKRTEATRVVARTIGIRVSLGIGDNSNITATSFIITISHRGSELTIKHTISNHMLHSARVPEAMLDMIVDALNAVVQLGVMCRKKEASFAKCLDQLKDKDPHLVASLARDLAMRVEEIKVVKRTKIKRKGPKPKRWVTAEAITAAYLGDVAWGSPNSDPIGDLVKMKKLIANEPYPPLRYEGGMYQIPEADERGCIPLTREEVDAAKYRLPDDGLECRRPWGTFMVPVMAIQARQVVTSRGEKEHIHYVHVSAIRAIEVINNPEPYYVYDEKIKPWMH